MNTFKNIKSITRPPLKPFARIFLLLFLFSSLELFGQFGKGPQSHAVIIGISDYEDDDIPDLQFAHRDAEAFAKYVSDISPLQVKEDHVVLLINDRATGGHVHQALNSLLETVKPRDKVFIYFSGHGDVETINEKDEGHLLLYDTPAQTYSINSLRVHDLNEIVNKLSSELDAEVFLITDACRSGTLAGASIHGPQATAAALNKQFANETKILSCQPDEFSLEGKQWGGGRGLFSFHFIDGLIGLADANDDQQLTLRELQRHLEDHVELDAEPHIQSPIVMGNKNRVISLVDQEQLAQLVQDKSMDSQTSTATMSTIFKKEIPNTDQSFKTTLDDFYTAIESKHFLPEENQSGSAKELFDKMGNMDIPETQLKIIKGEFIAALQDDAQHAINSYLKADNKELTKRELNPNQSYDQFPEYLAIAAEILGPQNYLYGQLLVKQFYFEAVNKRLQYNSSSSSDKAELQAAKQLIEKALIYEDNAAYLYNELGLILFKQKDPKAKMMFERAIEISPQWALPYTNLSELHTEMLDYTLAEKFAKKAIEISPKFKRGHILLSTIYYELEQYIDGTAVLEKYIEKYGNDFLVLRNLAGFYLIQDDPSKAKKYFLGSLEIAESFNPHLELASIYKNEKDNDKALHHYLKAFELRPDMHDILSLVAQMYYEIGNIEKAIEYYLKVIEVNPSDLAAYLNGGANYYNLEKYDKAEELFLYVVQNIDANEMYSNLFLAKLKIKENKFLPASQFLQILLKNKLMTFEEIKSEVGFSESFIDSDEFQQLSIKK